MDIVSYALSKKYTEDTAIGLGAVKGAPCVVQSIVDTGTENEVTFKWTGIDGTEQTRVMVARHGVSVVGVDVDEITNKLTCSLSDGTTYDCGTINVVTDANGVDYTTSKNTSIRNVKSALDKLFEDGGGILEEAITPNVTIGSVKSNYPIGTSLEEIIRDILTEKVQPLINLAINPSNTLYDIVNNSVSTLTINATVTKKTNPIAKIEYYINDTLVNTNTSATGSGSYPYIYNTVINETTIIKVVVTDTEGLSSAATKKIEFYPVIYYGIVDANTSEPNEAIIKTLGTKLQNTKTFNYEGITTDWGKVCVCIPKALGTISTILDPVNNLSYNSSFATTTVNIDGYDYSVLTQIDPSAASGITLKFS